MTKRKTTEKAIIKKNSPLTPPRFKVFGGSDADEFNRPLLESVLSTVWVPESEQKKLLTRQRLAALAALAAIRPTNEIEGMLAAQIVASHNGAMECYRRAMFPNQTFEGRQQNLSYGTKLSRTFASLLEALDRQRGKGQQKVTVEHVHVHQGGQAIVGNVQTGVGVQQKTEEQPHAQAITHALEPEMRSAFEAVGQPVPERRDE